MIPRAVEVLLATILSSGCMTNFPQDIFARAAAFGRHASISVSYMEIYKDEVYDLLVDRETVSANNMFELTERPTCDTPQGSQAPSSRERSRSGVRCQSIHTSRRRSPRL